VRPGHPPAAVDHAGLQDGLAHLGRGLDAAGVERHVHGEGLRAILEAQVQAVQMLRGCGLLGLRVAQGGQGAVLDLLLLLLLHLRHCVWLRLKDKLLRVHEERILRSGHTCESKCEGVVGGVAHQGAHSVQAGLVVAMGAACAGAGPFAGPGLRARERERKGADCGGTDPRRHSHSLCRRWQAALQAEKKKVPARGLGWSAGGAWLLLKGGCPQGGGRAGRVLAWGRGRGFGGVRLWPALCQLSIVVPTFRAKPTDHNQLTEPCGSPRAPVASSGCARLYHRESQPTGATRRQAHSGKGGLHVSNPSARAMPHQAGAIISSTAR